MHSTTTFYADICLVLMINFENVYHAKVQILTLKVPFTTTEGFLASVDQDQAAQNMLPDL